MNPISYLSHFVVSFGPGTPSGQGHKVVHWGNCSVTFQGPIIGNSTRRVTFNLDRAPKKIELNALKDVLER